MSAVINSTPDSNDESAQRTRLAKRSFKTGLVLFVSTALSLHVPFAVVLWAQGIRLNLTQCSSEYAKLLGSTLVSVLVAYGWKRFDRQQHRTHAETTRALAMERLRSMRDALQALQDTSLVHYNLDAPLTERAVADKEHKRLCELILNLLREVRFRLDTLTQEARNHIRDFDSCLVLLTDTLIHHGRLNTRETADALRLRVRDVVQQLRPVTLSKEPP